MPIRILSPAYCVTRPTMPGPMLPPRSPAIASSANMAVPPAGKLSEERLIVPGHIIPTEKPHIIHPVSPMAGLAESDARSPCRSPTVERMEQAHGGLLILKGACLHNRATEHLDQPAAYSIQDYAAENPRKRIRQNLRQDRQPGRGTGLRSHNAHPVPYPVHKPGTEQIHQKLRKEKTGGDQSDIPKGNSTVSIPLPRLSSPTLYVSKPLLPPGFRLSAH